MIRVYLQYMVVIAFVRLLCLLWRLVLSKYETAFEEALDQRSQIHFAAACARAQANDEISETRRQTATLYNAVLDSRRRHERMHEAIEKAETASCKSSHI